MKPKLLATAALTILLSAVPIMTVFAESPTAAYRVNRGDPKLVSSGRTVDAMVAEFMAANGLPGLTMAIVQAPYIPRSAGYGRTSTVNDELASTKTMWGIGPITQAFTAVAVFQLKETGKLDIHAPIARYVSGLPAAWRDITVLDLLQHASGIPDFRAASAFQQAGAYRPADLLDLVRSEPLLFQPGSKAQMSATDFILLGLAIERASGVSYEDFIRRRQIEPLGLTSTMFQPEFAQRSFLDRPPPTPGENQHVRFKSEIPYNNPVEPATGYQSQGDTLQPVDVKLANTLWAYGGLWSSAEDISKWDIALAGSTLVKDEADRDLIYRPARLARGGAFPAMAGWEFTRHPGFMEIKGDAPGFSAYLSRFTAADELVCVTLLTNRQGVDLTDLARDIADAYMSGLGSGADSEQLVTQESKFSVDETVDRLKAGLRSMDIPVFAEFDHGENAQKAGLSLRPTKVIVFGNPKVGTRLMADRQLSGIDLPLRLEVWQDARGRVWVSYHNMKRFGADYDIKDTSTLATINAALDKLVQGAVNAYAY